MADERALKILFDRYGSPKAISEDIERWLADEPISIYREPAPARPVRRTVCHDGRSLTICDGRWWLSVIKSCRRGAGDVGRRLIG